MPDPTVLEEEVNYVSVLSKLIVSIGSVVAMVAGAVFWMQSTFAEASDMLEVRASIVQMQIDSAKKELRGLRRDYRRASKHERVFISDDIDEVSDELGAYKDMKNGLLNER